MTPDAVPPRVRVTAPRAGIARRTTIASEIDAQTELGEVYMRSLVRTQLRLALRTTMLLTLIVGALPLLFHFLPGLRTFRIAGIALPWLLLGAGIYPILLLLAWSHIRKAERHERAFNDLLRPR